MKQQENMILNQLNQYRNLYLQACNENTRLKHAMSKHEDELKANQSVIESLEDRIREQGEELIEEKQNIKQISEELDSCKKKLGEEREDHLKTKAELKQAKEDIAKLQVAKEAKELSEQANVDLLSVVQVLQPEAKWCVKQLVIASPSGDELEIKCSNLAVVVELLRKMSM
jgi:transposase